MKRSIGLKNDQIQDLPFLLSIEEQIRFRLRLIA